MPASPASAAICRTHRVLPDPPGRVGCSVFGIGQGEGGVGTQVGAAGAGGLGYRLQRREELGDLVRLTTCRLPSGGVRSGSMSARSARTAVMSGLVSVAMTASRRAWQVHPGQGVQSLRLRPSRSRSFNDAGSSACSLGMRMVRTPQRSQWRSRVWSSALRVAPKWCGPSTSMMTARPLPITTKSGVRTPASRSLAPSACEAHGAGRASWSARPSAAGHRRTPRTPAPC